MTILFVIGWIAFCIFVTYFGMRVICWIKREYALAEHWLARGIIKIITFFEEVCAECKKGCQDHPLMLRRAIRIGLLIGVCSSAAWLLARC